MKSLIGQTGYFRPAGSKVVMAITLITALSLLSMASAFADRNNNGPGGRGGNRHSHHGEREWRGDNDDYGYGYNRQRYGYGNRQPYYNYAQPVYIPPPVYYGPMQSPGINLVFPLNFRHR